MVAVVQREGKRRTRLFLFSHKALRARVVSHKFLQAAWVLEGNQQCELLREKPVEHLVEIPLLCRRHRTVDACVRVPEYIERVKKNMLLYNEDVSLKCELS